jgi:LysR family transcriptional regulator for metE and metH
MKDSLKGMLANITRRQLRAFAAVVETGSISKAAQALGITPPAVSLQMRLLEEAAGLPLLDRGKGSMRPTDAGKLVMRAAGDVEAAVAACAEQIAALSGVERGRVTVGIISTAKYFVPRALAIFSREHPGIDVRLMVGNRGAVLAALADARRALGRIDEALASARAGWEAARHGTAADGEAAP